MGPNKYINMRLFTVIIFFITFLSFSKKKDREVNNYHRELTQAVDSAALQKKESTPDSSFKEMSIKRMQSYGTTNEILVGDIADFTVDDKNRVYIADMDQTTVHVFNTDGSYYTSLGREGNGPAEFAAITPNTTVCIYLNKLYVTDYSGAGNYYPSRAQVFNLNKELSFDQTLKLIPSNRDDYIKLEGYSPNKIYPKQSGKFLVSYRKSPSVYLDSTKYIRYFVLDSTGSVIDGPVLQQKGKRYLTYHVKNVPTPYWAIRSFSFFEKSLFTVTEKGELYTARSMEFKIDILNSEGEYQRSIEYPFDNVSVTAEELLEYYEKKDLSGLGPGKIGLKMIREAESLPNQWPALHTMFFDDKDRLWVATIVEDMEIYEWWILEKSGEVITKFEWPRQKPIKTVKNGYLYTQEEDERGVGQIVKYKIQIH
ncbi:6-bladed beta-propeller [Fodinibius halophilus]|uniref:6-bladed beta-propeller n=1 Tax=Fodinibius halophilus TaxID=1736908 RepID=A0A6M1T6S2_9BACT|nr:6-bladed beta-propeller [Fodinibius halophilus]NGP87731.1 6-bladed beta-propeller [Fodinibius halophilus]